MLTVLGCILGPVAVLGVWAGNEVSDTGRWVATVEPRISSLLDAFGPQFSSAVTGFIHSTVQKVISSPAVAKIWVQVNTVGHQALVKVLSGDGNGAVSTSNGQITLNLGLFIAVVKQDLVDHGFSLASNIPIISPTVALFQGG